MVKKKQKTVATSSAEAEYITTATCIKKILEIKNILYELFQDKQLPTLFTDNLASMTNLKKGVVSQKLRHIRVNYHFVKESITKK